MSWIIITFAVGKQMKAYPEAVGNSTQPNVNVVLKY